MVKPSKRAAAAFALAAIATTSALHAASWNKTAAGSYQWNTNANWDTSFPNAAGALANLDVGLVGNQAITLNQAITIGQLNIGDTGGTGGVKTSISSGSGGNPITFQGATPGSGTSINLNLSATVSGGANTITLPGINLAANSPMTITANSTATTEVFSATGTLNIGSNNLTFAGSPVTNIESVDTVTGNLWLPGGLTGSGNITINGSGVELDNAAPAFTGSITINNGMFALYGNGNVASASQYVLAGGWNETFVSPNDNKYPIGGLFKVGNPGSPIYTSVQPSRLNPSAPMIFKGGFLEDLGQGLTMSFVGTNIVEQVKQIQFVNGMSEIRMQDGNLQTDPGPRNTNFIAASTTLLANDPTNACVRQQGATVMVGGDDNSSRDGTFPDAMGVVEKLVFASGMSQYLKGAGGADGTMNKSIIPWMTDGTIYHPGQGLFMTYDATNGVRCLAANEYYYLPDADNGSTLKAADPTYNVSTVDVNAGTGILNLGTNQTKTINSFQDQARTNSDIGAGSVLTITSGAIEFNGPGKIGADRATAGTINFGTAEGIIWSDQDCEYGDTPFGNNVIGSVIAGSGGLTIAGKNRLLLTNANTYTGKTSVGSGILQIGDGTVTDAKLGAGNLEVAASATLTIAAHISNAISDSAAVSLDDNGDTFFGMINLATGINETVGRLFLNGVLQPTGAYGSAASSATNKLNNYFAGSGILTSTPDNLVWDNHLSATGDGSSWDLGTTGTSLNWNNVGSANPFYAGDNVTFNDSNNNHYTVNLAASVSPLSVTFNNSNNNYVLSGNGGITGSTGLTKSGTGSLTLSTANNYSGTTNINQGALTLTATGTISNSTITVGNGATSGTLNLAAGTSGILTRTFAGLTITNTGTVNVSPATLHNNRSLVIIGTGGFTSGGKLDLSNNDMIIKGGAPNITSIKSQLQAGFNAGIGYWNGTSGIVSTSAAGDSTHLTTLGYRTGGSPFDNANTTSSDLLVKYTYYGDADLNGSVNGADYQQIDMGFGNHLTGWSNGDFNYDGVVNGTDFALIDNSINQLAATSATSLALLANPAGLIDQKGQISADVPEPASLGFFAGIGVILLNSRARSRNHSKKDC